MRRLSEADREWAVASDACNKYRAWTTSDGEKVRGKYVRHGSGKVIFETRQDEVRVPFLDLCDTDRALLATYTEGALSETHFEPEQALVASLVPEGERMWTDVNGKEIFAEYRGVEGERVVLYYKNRAMASADFALFRCRQSVCREPDTAAPSFPRRAPEMAGASSGRWSR